MTASSSVMPSNKALDGPPGGAFPNSFDQLSTVSWDRVPFEGNDATFTAIFSSSGPEPVTIDIKPGSDPNSINLQGNAVIPVAILTTESFDAIQVDPLTVAFGPNGASEFHGRSHVNDIDDDGDADLILHFKTQETGIACGDTEATLTGETFGGGPATISGTDAIRTVNCP